MGRGTIAALLLALAFRAPASAQPEREPIIDMHMHAWSIANEFGGPAPEICAGADGLEMNGIDPSKPIEFEALVSCKHKLKPSTDATLLRDSLRMMDRFNIVRGVISGDTPVVAKWRSAAPGRFIAGANFFIDDNRPPASRAAELEAAVKRGETEIFAEITAQYRGLSPDDSSLDPFYAAAERLDMGRLAARIGSIPSTAPRSETRCCWRTCSSAIPRCASM